MRVYKHHVVFNITGLINGVGYQKLICTCGFTTKDDEDNMRLHLILNEGMTFNGTAA